MQEVTTMKIFKTVLPSISPGNHDLDLPHSDQVEYFRHLSYKETWDRGQGSTQDLTGQPKVKVVQCSGVISYLV